MPIETLPDNPLHGGGPLSRRFIARACRTYRDAARSIRDLPYARNTKTPAYLSVLDDGCGTCSSKHALAVTLANELHVELRLMLGIYEMNEENTPGVGGVLSEARLWSIPEAHCWIEFDGIATDLTSPTAECYFDKRRFFYREMITPEQTGSYKSDLHHQRLSEWAANQTNANLTADAAWAIRERCIAVLSQQCRLSAEPNHSHP